MTISTESKKPSKMAQLKMSIKSLDANVAFCEGSKDSLKGDLVVLAAGSTWLGQLFVDVRVKVADLQKTLDAREAVTSIYP